MYASIYTSGRATIGTQSTIIPGPAEKAGITGTR